MSVDIKDFRRLNAEQQAEQPVAPEPVPLPSADIREFLTDNEIMNTVVHKLGVYLGQLDAAVKEATDKMPFAVNEQASRSMQIHYWKHAGIAQGVRDALTTFKQHASGSKS
jgi:hypothetical protein